jgi:predicted ATPase with chaperone activity
LPITDLTELSTVLDSSTEARPEDLSPPVPETIPHTGVPSTMIEQLLLKSLYYNGELVGRELAQRLGLRFSVIEAILEGFKRTHHVTVRSSLGMGAISSRFVLTESGRELAKEFVATNAYSGRVPVPLFQYADMVRRQKQENGWLTQEALREAYKHMVVTPELLNQIGPAVNSGKSFLIYGQPGNGKTYLAEALFNVDPTYIYVPYAIEAQGMIIQMFDPVYHHPVDEAQDTISAFTTEPSYDQRWFKCHRPFIVTGGELAPEMLDLSFNPVAKFYDAPLQLKANNGIYLIDDFGRQKVTPAEVLNRWIVPMERRVDYLSFQNGGKMTIPFECFLVFSSNLKPDQLGDEAFLRRIQYKMLMKSPSEQEFTEIFVKYAAKQGLACSPELVDRFLARHYRSTGKPRRRCHPRDVLSHAIDIIRFERRPTVLTDEVLTLAFESNFVSTEEDD